MMSSLLRNRESRLKEGILKGVYEDNLRIIGKGSYRRRKPSDYPYRKMLILLLLLLTAYVVQGSFSHLAVAPARYPAESIAASPKKLQPTSTGMGHVTENPPETDFNGTPPDRGGLVAPAAREGNSSESIAPLLVQTVMPDSPFPSESLVKPSDFNGLLERGNIPLSRMFGLGVKTIMIDPGHGGDDPGTIGSLGTKEKDITLDIARRLKERLEKHEGYNILMTREDDATLPLQRRVYTARESRADLFVSIHINYLPKKPINIIETYYFGPSSDPKIMRLAEKENVGSEYALSDFKQMIEKIGDTLKLQESRNLATSIQKELFVSSRRQNSHIYNYGVKRAPFVVLLGVDVPSVLTEVSCMSNREEEVQLNTEAHRENIASYLEKGILDYLDKGDFIYEAKRQ
ncbi:MAG: N-acetylmuramoyl-L-alanine amidase [Thermodesulfobacteriota bacterium]